MITFSLQSGSNGNCIYVEAGDVRLLFDAGITARAAMQRLERHGRRIRDVNALLLSHDHIDHVSSAGAFHRLFGMPVYCTAGTHRVIRGRLGKIANLQLIKASGEIRFGAVVVRTIPTPHDAADGVAFVVEFESKRLGIFTDLGHPFDRLRQSLGDCDAAYLESNYDPEMLESGPYSALLKARIRGDGGHISNNEAAEMLRARNGRRPRWIALAHLSQENNRPDVALRTHRSMLGDDYPLFVAGRDGPTELLHV